MESRSFSMSWEGTRQPLGNITALILQLFINIIFMFGYMFAILVNGLFLSVFLALYTLPVLIWGYLGYIMWRFLGYSFAHSSVVDRSGTNVDDGQAGTSRNECCIEQQEERITLYSMDQISNLDLDDELGDEVAQKYKDAERTTTDIEMLNQTVETWKADFPLTKD